MLPFTLKQQQDATSFSMLFNDTSKFPPLKLVKPLVFDTLPLVELFIDLDCQPVLELMVENTEVYRTWVYVWLSEAQAYQLLNAEVEVHALVSSSPQCWLNRLIFNTEIEGTAAYKEIAGPIDAKVLHSMLTQEGALVLDHPLEVKRALKSCLAYYSGDSLD